MNTQSFIIETLPGQRKTEWWEIREKVSLGGKHPKIEKRAAACFGLLSAFSQIVTVYLVKGRKPRRIDVRVYFETEDGGKNGK